MNTNQSLPAEKPGNLIYGVHETPPFAPNLLLGFQHITMLLISCIFPVIIVQLLGDSLSPRDARAFVSLSLLMGGLITILQSLGKKGIGSGYLCPSVSSPTYLDATSKAAMAGGLPLVFGMTILAGLAGTLLSRVMHRLRPFFPPEVTGTVVALVGIVVIPVSVKSLAGTGFNDPVSEPAEVAVGLLTLAILVGLNTFSRGKLRLFSAILGMAAGYLLSFLCGITGPEDFRGAGSGSFFEVPWIRTRAWDFSPALIIPFLIASFSSVLKVTGDIATCQRINDARWKRVDMQNISAGILADGLGGILSGLAGGFGQSTSSSNIGLSVATGATSRSIALATGAIAIVLAFLPSLAGIFLAMPGPVMGALLIFSVAFMIIAGIQMILSRMLDTRRIFVVGIALIFGLSADMVPQLYGHLPPAIHPLFSSSLSLGAVTVVLLNLILRIGIRRKAMLQIGREALRSPAIVRFTEAQGQQWGALPAVITKVSFAIAEMTEAIYRANPGEIPVDLTMTFDEFNIEVIMNYQGRAVNPEPGSRLSTGEAAAGSSIEELTGYLIARYCDRVKVQEKNGEVKIRMHFDH